MFQNTGEKQTKKKLIIHICSNDGTKLFNLIKL